MGPAVSPARLRPQETPRPPAAAAPAKAAAAPAKAASAPDKHAPVRHATVNGQTVPGRPDIGLVAIDLDGTLLRSDKRLSKKVVNAVKAASARGVRVVLASARPPRSVREIYGHLGLDTFQINYNGALIHDAPRARHVFHQPLDGGLAMRVAKAARKADPRVVVSVEILDKWYTDHYDESLPTETSKAFVPDFIGPLESFLHVPITKLMLLAPPLRMKKTRQLIIEKFGRQVGIAVTDAHLVQVIHPEVDKSRALARIAKEYGVPQANVMAIGDAPNDTGMISWAGLGVAVGNAWEDVRKVADEVVGSNDADGVAEALRKFVLE